jgi:molecular chaperone GrpE
MSVENQLPNEATQDPQEQVEQTSEEQGQNFENDTTTDLPDDDQIAEQSNEQIDEYKEKFIRLYAEFENYRRRTNLERLELIASANGGLLKDLLPVLDDLDRAIANNEQLEDVQALREGFQLIQHKFKQILLSKGLKEMEAKGHAFDSDLHEAIANIPAPEDALKGKVIDDVEKGYYLNDKVLRFAKVVVGQ